MKLFDAAVVCSESFVRLVEFLCGFTELRIDLLVEMLLSLDCTGSK